MVGERTSSLSRESKGVCKVFIWSAPLPTCCTITAGPSTQLVIEAVSIDQEVEWLMENSLPLPCASGGLDYGIADQHSI